MIQNNDLKFFLTLGHYVNQVQKLAIPLNVGVFKDSRGSQKN